jgi:hypothetical protein
MTLKGVEISSLPVADSLFCFGSHLGNFPIRYHCAGAGGPQYSLALQQICLTGHQTGLPGYGLTGSDQIVTVPTTLYFLLLFSTRYNPHDQFFNFLEIVKTLVFLNVVEISLFIAFCII